MKGSSLGIMSEQRLQELKVFPVLFARASPNDKLKIVKALQHSGEIVWHRGSYLNLNRHYCTNSFPVSHPSAQSL